MIRVDDYNRSRISKKMISFRIPNHVSENLGKYVYFQVIYSETSFAKKMVLHR